MKKCLVLDLDNTLWGGIVGEEGLGGIKLGLDSSGRGFVAFQQAILDLYNRGIILALNSRNNYEDALAVLRRHPNMVLKENNFAATRINWDEKPDNMREIAKELNIGLDSMVFLDDDPVNRALMRNALPEVETPDLPSNPEDYAKFLLGLSYFQGAAITDEDKMRGNLYVTERLRKAAENNYGSKEDFLKSLEIEVHCYEDDSSCIPRLAQLTEKTNQFNTNKKPMSESEISRQIEGETHSIFYAAARDKFGDYGVIGFAAVNKSSEEWLIESMLASCRALGRGVEEAFLHFIAEKARENNAKGLRILFKETEKNQPAKEFLEKYFEGGRFDLKNVSIKPNWIKTIWKSSHP